MTGLDQNAKGIGLIISIVEATKTCEFDRVENGKIYFFDAAHELDFVIPTSFTLAQTIKHLLDRNAELERSYEELRVKSQIRKFLGINS